MKKFANIIVTFPAPLSNRSRASIRSIYFSLTFKKQTTFLRFGRKNVYSIGKANLLQREISSVGGGRGREREKKERRRERFQWRIVDINLLGAARFLIISFNRNWAIFQNPSRPTSFPPRSLSNNSNFVAILSLGI